MFRNTPDFECGCCKWPKNKCLCGYEIDQYGGLFALLDVSGERIPINVSGFPETRNSINGEPTREILGRVAPCAFKVTIDGVINSSELKGFCNHCENFNGEYYLHKTNDFARLNDCLYSSLMCDESKEEVCGKASVNIKLFPKSLPTNGDVDIAMKLFFEPDAYSLKDLDFISYPYLGVGGSPYFQKNIGILYSGGIDSNLVGPTITGVLDISNYVEVCPTNTPYGTCNFDNISISLEALSNDQVWYNIDTIDECILLQNIKDASNNSLIPHHDNQFILLKLDNIVGLHDSIPFSGALLTTCYDCDDLNTEFELWRRNPTTSAQKNVIPMSGLYSPSNAVGDDIYYYVSGDLFSIISLWEYELEYFKNDSSPKYIDTICCKNSDELIEYTEVGSCINKITMHIQKEFSSQSSVETTPGIWQNDWYYNYYGVINLINKNPYTEEELLVHQLYKNICDDCHHYDFLSIMKGVLPRDDTPIPTLVDCGGTFNGTWIENEIITSVPSGQRPCDFSNLEVEISTTSRYPVASGCNYYYCICFDRDDINRDIQVTIPNNWVVDGICDGSPNLLAGDYILSTSNIGICQTGKRYDEIASLCSSDDPQNRVISFNLSVNIYDGQAYATVVINQGSIPSFGFPTVYTYNFIKLISSNFTCGGHVANCSELVGEYEYSNGNTEGLTWGGGNITVVYA